CRRSDGAPPARSTTPACASSRSSGWIARRPGSNDAMATKLGGQAHTPSGEPGPQVEEAFERGVAEGTHRLDRSLPSLIATGLVGGLDLGIGVFAMLIVRQETGSKLLGALAFGLGFIALTLAGSELFTENFLIPITAVIVIRRHGP